MNWKKYKHDKGALTQIQSELIDMMQKLDDSVWEKQSRLLGPQGLNGIPAYKRKTFWELADHKNELLNVLAEKLLEVNNMLSV